MMRPGHTSPSDVLVFDHTKASRAMLFGEYVSVLAVTEATDHQSTTHWLSARDSFDRRITARLWHDQENDRLILEPVVVEVDCTQAMLTVSAEHVERPWTVPADLKEGCEVVISDGRGVSESEIVSVRLGFH